MATIWKHGEGDWCHICGNRQAVTADIFYPDATFAATGKQ